MEKDYIYLNWCNKFSCPGGDCGLTCCTSDWNIYISEAEIEGYRRLNPPFRDEVLDAIDLEKKKMKCTNGFCDLLDENQYCKLVIKEGPKALSYTCTTFPWNINDFEFLCENTVEIACPLVAEYLFDTEPLDFEVRTLKVKKFTKNQVKIREYLNLFSLRSRLIDIFQNQSGEYIYGKIFILNKIYNDTTRLLKKGMLDDNTVEALLAGYSDENVINSICSQCEPIAKGISLREGLIYEEFIKLIKEEFAVLILSNSIYKDASVTESFNVWLNNRNEFVKDLNTYVDYMNKNYPTFLQNYFVYSLFRNWNPATKKGIENGIPTRFFEIFFIQLCGMAVMRKCGFVDKKMFSVLIARLDRVVAHGDAEKYMSDYYFDKCDKDPIEVIMTMIG